MSKTTKYLRLALAVILVTGMSSCRLFKKNKCGDCPTWGSTDVVKQEASIRV